MRVPALLYHRIGPKIPGTLPYLTLSPERFERQLLWLVEHGYRGIRASEWIKASETDDGLPSKPVLITIDDGYADLGDYAFPILRRFGFSATAYIVTGYVGATNIWDQHKGSAAIALMDADQIRHWATNGIEFGCHSRTHRDLSALSGFELESEISGSKQDLQEMLRIEPVSFALPFGKYDANTMASARRSFQLVLTCDEGLNEFPGNLQILKRLMIVPRESSFACRVAYGCTPLQLIRGSLRIRTRLRKLAALGKTLA
jgi:peptidoglycan/xylan/chitin deacetylase (PgdA/CDA1 family)